MKKQLIAVAVCGAFCGLAQAESGVTVYGILDASVMTGSKACTNTICTLSNGAATGSTTGSVIGFQDAAILPSIFGFSGKEDLGGGLHAGFTLEEGFNVGSGAINSSNGVLTNSPMFGRLANLTLGGDWGTFGAGLQLDPAFEAAIGTEPRGMTDSFSSLEHWITATLGVNSPVSPPPVILSGGIFDSNSIRYSYSGNGLTVGLLYGFGGVAGSTEASSQESLGASYTNSGATVSAGWVEAHAHNTTTTPTYTGASDEIYFIGAGYATGPFAVRVQYQDFKSNYNLNGTVGNNVKDWGIGGDWKAGANTLNLSFYDAKDDGAGSGAAQLIPNGDKTTEWALLDTYSLSKRTSVYGQIASVKVASQTATSGPGVSGALGGIYTPVGLYALTGTTTTYINIGIQHTF